MILNVSKDLPKKALNTNYLAFTNNAFLKNETVYVAELLEEGYEAAEIREKIIEDNPFSLRSEASRKTMSTAILSRFEHAPDFVIDNLASGESSLQNFTTFYLIMLKHRLLREFLAEVLLEHRNRLVYTVTDAEINSFFEHKHILEADIESWSEATLSKSRTNIIIICISVGLLVNSKEHYDILSNFVPTKLRNDLLDSGQESFLKLMLDGSS